MDNGLRCCFELTYSIYTTSGTFGEFKTRENALKFSAGELYKVLKPYYEITEEETIQLLFDYIIYKKISIDDIEEKLQRIIKKESFDWITVEEEEHLPVFHSHEEARAYFKEMYGDNFQMVDSDFIDNEKIYFYNLIVDMETYLKGIEILERKGYIDEDDGNQEDFLYSAQPIQIYSDGRVHIVH